MAFEQEKLKFEAPKRTMKIDKHPFATNMVDINKDKGLAKTKDLMSESDKGSGAGDPDAQISADEVKGKEPQDDAKRSSVPRRRVTS